MCLIWVGSYRKVKKVGFLGFIGSYRKVKKVGFLGFIGTYIYLPIHGKEVMAF
jgi:hypothetical protein